MKTNPESSLGLTKREEFAAFAMQNIQNVLLRKSGVEALQKWVDHFGYEGPDRTEHTIARLAVTQADALIKILNAT